MTKPLLLSAFAALAPIAAMANSGGAVPGMSGAPGDQTCVACHGGTPNSGPGRVTISFAGGATTYTPGQKQRITVNVSDPNARRWGFEVSPRLASDPENRGAGTLEPADGNTALAGESGTIQWLTHTRAGTRAGTANGVAFEFDWTPPASDSGEITFYVAANAANNNNNNTGDLIYSTSARLTPSAGPIGGNKPAIAQNGVVNGASFEPGLVPGSWFTIQGSNFGSNTRLWRADEIVNGQLPASLDGVSVTVNGKPASVYYISPGQINAQAPDDDSTGTVNVVVTTPAGVSDPIAVTLEQQAPALFLFDPQNRKYPAAVAANGAYLGPSGLFGTALATRPATPGETILLFGTGFGRTNPAVPAGQAFSGAAPLVNQPQITIGGVNAAVSFAGLSGAGLYQFNVVVPEGTQSGDQPVIVTVNGRSTQSNVMLAVQRP